MWQIYALMAQDMARERRREADAVALARLAKEVDADERRAHPALGRDAVRRAGVVRRTIAASLRRISGAADTLARSACDAATRVDGAL